MEMGYQAGERRAHGACGIRFNLIARPRGTLTFSFRICGGLVSGDSCEICFRLRSDDDDDEDGRSGGRGGGGGAQTIGQSVGGVALAAAADF